MPDNIKSELSMEADELAESEKRRIDRSKCIEEIKEDLRLTLDIIQEASRTYTKIDSVAWPVAVMVLFNEVRQTRSSTPFIQSSWPVGNDPENTHDDRQLA